MEPGGVTHLPEPVSPTNRSRVHKVKPTNRSHNVQYQPKPHKAAQQPLGFRMASGWLQGGSQESPGRDKTLRIFGIPRVFFVAGAGFEPATFGL